MPRSADGAPPAGVRPAPGGHVRRLHPAAPPAQLGGDGLHPDDLVVGDRSGLPPSPFPAFFADPGVGRLLRPQGAVEPGQRPGVGRAGVVGDRLADQLAGVGADGGRCAVSSGVPPVS